MFKKILKISAVIIGAAVIVIASQVVRPDLTGAQSTATQRLYGYAWSSNIGWISFKESQSKVEINSTGYLNGYAWSPNIGWVKFGGLGTPPYTGGNSQTQARIDPVTGVFSGWARACLGTRNADCDSFSRTDGWDGWISLKGSSYGLKVSNNTVVGSGSSAPFAWGSNVIGWINFEKVTIESNEAACETILPGATEPVYIPSGQTEPVFTKNGNDCSTQLYKCEAGVLVPEGGSVSTTCEDVEVPIFCDRADNVHLAEGETVVRYSKSQVRAGETCADYKATLQCVRVSDTDGNDSGSLVALAPSGANASLYTFQGCRALPSYIER